VVREGLARASVDGVTARLVSMRLLSPAQPARLATALAGVRRILVIEQNHTGQFFRHLRAEYDLPGTVTSLRRQRGHDLHRHGQPRVSHDEGTAFADDRAGLGLKALSGRHRAARISSDGDRAVGGRELEARFAV
jgi:hypothetical protein